MSKMQLMFLVALSACGGTKSTGAVEPTTQPAAPERHTIKIHRPFTAGQVVDVEVEAHQISKAAVAEGGDPQVVGVVEQLDISLVGDVTIDEVAPDGRAQVATLHVKSFTNPVSKAVILPPDSVVHAKRVDGVLMPVLEGGTLTPDQELLLMLAFPLERPGSRLGDELFGTPESRAVGDTWPFNRAYVVEDLREEGYGASETGIDGDVKLVEIVPCGKVQCLKLEVDMKATNASMAAVKNASDVGAGELVSTIVLEVPMDETTPVHMEDATTTLTFAATLTVGDQTQHRGITVTRQRRATYTPKK